MCGGDDFEHHIVHILRAVADVQPQLWLGVRGDSAARDHTTCTGDISQRAGEERPSWEGGDGGVEDGIGIASR